MDFPIIFKFLKALSKNNNREWFEKHKGEYLEAKDTFELFVTNLLHEMIKRDPSLASLNPKKLAFRIYRDVRFSKDKRPYKTNMGATFSAGGKLMSSPGYYVHIEQGNKSFVAGGLYMPSPEHVFKIRQEIDYNAVKLKKIFSESRFRKLYKDFDEFDKLKNAPKGFPTDHPQLEWLKLKSYTVSHYFSDSDVQSKNFLKKTSLAHQAMQPLNSFLGEAMQS